MSIRSFLLFFAFAGWQLAARANAAAEDYSQWSQARVITLNTSATGADIATDQSGFPVLINLSAQQADVFDGAEAGGADLRFATAQGAHLHYQIELWDKTARKAAIWVRVDIVKAAVAAQGLRLYWGKPGAPDSSDGKAVFRSADGYLGVWHLGNSVEDASANANHGIDSGTAAAADGRIGGARYFENPEPYVKTGKYIALGNPAGMNIAGKVTFEAWVKWIRRDGHRIIICHGAAAGSNSETVLRIGETSDYRAGTWTGSAHYATLLAPTADSNAWVHLAGVHTGSSWLLYRNGRQVSQLADSNGAKPSPGAWRIGAEYASASVTRYFHGWLDEVRLSNIARNPDWIKLGYENQKDAQTLVTIGPAVTGLAGRAARNARSGAARIGSRPGQRLYPLPTDPHLACDASGSLVPQAPQASGAGRPTAP